MFYRDLSENDEIWNKQMFNLFQTNIEDILKNKFEWMVQKEIPSTVIDTWYYWEFEQYTKFLNKRNKEEREQHEEQDKKQNTGSFNPSSFNPNSMLKKFSGGNNYSLPRY